MVDIYPVLAKEMALPLSGQCLVVIDQDTRGGFRKGGEGVWGLSPPSSSFLPFLF